MLIEFNALPCSGKSYLSMKLYCWLAELGFNIEYIQEFYKCKTIFEKESNTEINIQEYFDINDGNDVGYKYINPNIFDKFCINKSLKYCDFVIYDAAIYSSNLYDKNNVDHFDFYDINNVLTITIFNKTTTYISNGRNETDLTINEFISESEKYNSNKLILNNSNDFDKIKQWFYENVFGNKINGE